MDALESVGPRLRAARRSRGLTLEDLSRETGISSSTISRLEAGKRQATLELLVPISRHLHVKIDDLLAGPTPDPRVRRAIIRAPGAIITPLAGPGSPIQTAKITLLARRDPPALRTHSGYEWLYVLAGRVLVRLGGNSITLLRGEAAEFDTSVPHSISAAGGKQAQIISIFNEEGARIHTRVGGDGYAGGPPGTLTS
ncbi:helix-turn-helix domain-containing protein [Rarobacter incanus]|uniref:XRE family transcriptional regulator n=1 Tax=Rarobacter incanus TaxID=153494 RepID=A0A542SPB9_9MICO|nr:XRE family transcriptional regulator [Rarobacter incanus]TQK76405.1 XRE family transcriptional regulator [Rarobacter incanus]